MLFFEVRLIDFVLFFLRVIGVDCHVIEYLSLENDGHTLLIFGNIDFVKTFFGCKDILLGDSSAINDRKPGRGQELNIGYVFTRPEIEFDHKDLLPSFRVENNQCSLISDSYHIIRVEFHETL